MKNYSDHIAIIGAGIAGLALGIMLKKNNIPKRIIYNLEWLAILNSNNDLYNKKINFYFII